MVQTGFNTFVLNEAGSIVKITIPVGNYNRRNFALVVAGLLTTNSPHSYVYTMTICSRNQAETGKFTYTVNSATQPTITMTNNLFEQFGFVTGSTNTFDASGNLVSTNVYKFQIEDTLYLHSTICTNGTDDILQEIYVADQPDFSNIHYTCSDTIAHSKALTTQHQNSYRFKLTDEDGLPIYLNGLNMVICILVYKRDNSLEFLKQVEKLKLLKQNNSTA
jgi:hypothetical protein